MRSRTILSILGGAALSLAAVGCSPAENTNANANRNANANATATPTATATPVSSSNSRNYNMTRDEYNKNANGYLAEAKNAGDSIGSDIEDGWIHLKVRGALAAVDDLRDSTINVDVDKKVVTLRGSVGSAAGKAAAEKAAKVDGATRVVNNLVVKADGSSDKAGNANTSNANKK